MQSIVQSCYSQTATAHYTCPCTFSTLHLYKFEPKRCEKFPKFIPHKTQPYTNTEDTHTSTHTSIQYFLFPIPSCLSTESLAKCGIIYYTVRPFVAILPAWWRFAQCVRRYINTREGFPHLVNAGKYSTCFFVVIFSTVAAALKGDRKRERERERGREREREKEGERERENGF